MTLKHILFKLKNSQSIVFKHALRAIFLFTAFITLEGCRRTLKDDGYNMGAINKEVKNRKIQRVSEAAFEQWVTQNGSEISRTAQKYLSRASDKAIKNKQIASYKEFSKVFPISNIDSLAKSHLVTIEAISFINSNSDNLYAIEAHLLKQYKNEEIALKPSVQYAEKRRKLLYIAPIYLKGAVGMWSIHFDRVKVINQIVIEREKKKKRK